MDIEKTYKLISAFLLIVIIGLGYWLYLSIVTPYEAQLEKERITKTNRMRMSDIRDLMIKFETENDAFPENLDSLVSYVKRDSSLYALADTSYDRSFDDNDFNIDSLIYTYRKPPQRFEYALNDTIRPNIYLLKDPYTKDKIGSIERTTMLNAANWE